MDTTRLHYFCVVTQTGSLQRASELLHLSPAALSKAMKTLEGEVGFPLLLPNGRGIAVTDRGRALARRAAPLLAQLEKLSVDSRSTEAARAVLRVGSFEVFTTHALSALAEAWDDADVVLHELTPGKLETAIAAGDVDLGITYLPIPHPDLDFLEVATAQMAVYARADIDEELPFAVPSLPLEGTPTKVAGLDGWPDHLVGRQIRYRVALMESALALCREGKAAAFLPTFVVDAHNRRIDVKFRLAARAVKLPPKYKEQPIYLVKRKSQSEDRTFKRLAKALRVLVK